MTIKRINFRVDDTDHYRYNLAAQALGGNLSDYLRGACEELVQRAIVEHPAMGEMLAKNTDTCAQP